MQLAGQVPVELCTPDAGQLGPSVLHVHHAPHQDQPSAASSAAHITTSTGLHLHLLLSALSLDQAFYVQHSPAAASIPSQPVDSTAADSTAADAGQLSSSAGLWWRSMVWAVQAHLRAEQACRASLVMGDQLSTADAGTLGVARTLFMEQRGLCGPALCLDPEAPPLSQQVC